MKSLNWLSILPYAGYQAEGWHWREAVNWQILLLVLLLSSLGLVMVTSASMSFAESNYGDLWYFSKRYLVYWLLGVLAAAFVASVPVVFWERHGSLFIVLALLLLVAVLVPGLGRRINGSQRWLQFGPLALQASEVVKFSVIVFYSSFLARHGVDMLRDWRGVFKPLLLLATLVFLLLLEPDFGASVVLIGTVMAMLFVAGVRLWQFALLLIAALGGLTALALQSSYRVERLTTFLDPWNDQFDSGYQLTQSLIAFGRGEWLGLGLGNSVQKLFYLPEAHTDFIFAVIAEELGLVGIVTIMVLFALLITAVLRVSQRALKAGRTFSSFACFGVVVLFSCQAFINLGVASGLLPTKGLTMPFLSYGGSSLLVCLALMALVVRIDWELRAAALSPAKPSRKNQSPKKGVLA